MTVRAEPSLGECAGRSDVATVDAILFDLEATLVDSKGAVEELWVEFAERHALPTEMVLGYAHGRQPRETIRRFLPATVDLNALVAGFRDAEADRLDRSVAMPGAGRLVRALCGARVAVVTSTPRALAGRRLVAADLPVPDVLIGEEDVHVDGPEPAGYLEAARRLGVAPSRCLAFEGTEAGTRAALSAGMAAVLVGQRPMQATPELVRVADLSAVDVIARRDGVVQVRCRSPRIGGR